MLLQSFFAGYTALNVMFVIVDIFFNCVSRNGLQLLHMASLFQNRFEFLAFDERIVNEISPPFANNFIWVTLISDITAMYLSDTLLCCFKLQIVVQNKRLSGKNKY